MEEIKEEERLETDSIQATKVKLPKKKKIKRPNHRIKVRAARAERLAKRGNNVYVRKKSSTKHLITYCKKLLQTEEEINIHGLGITCNKALNVARRLIDKFPGTLNLNIKTDPTNITEDLEPTNDDAVYEVNETSSIAVHIKVFRVAKVGPLKVEN